MIKKALYAILYTMIPIGLLVVLGFAEGRNRHTVCRELQVSVHAYNENYFIRPEQIRSLIYARIDSLEGRVIEPALLEDLYTLVRSVPFVEKANVYRTISGEVHVEISQRNPLVRVINTQNQSYYIDGNGVIFPLAEEHTARVMIATGALAQELVPGKNVLQLHDTITSDLQKMADLFRLASIIDKDVFWKAFIDHIYVTPSGKFELTPKNGAHIIELGYLNDIDVKLRNLRIFYLNSLTQVGWNYYRRINMEFKNQIVCSK